MSTPGLPLGPWSQIVGQRATVKALRTHAAGARKRGRSLHHVLFEGPAGCGKTTLARAYGQESGCEFLELTGSHDLSPYDIYLKLVELRAGDGLFIDEGHALRNECQLLLCEATERRLLTKREPGTRNGRLKPGETVSLPCFTLAIGTDQPDALSSALLSRLTLKVTVTYSSEAELRQIVELRAKDAGVRLSSHAIGLLARAARGVPRRARQLLALISTYFSDSTQEISKPELRAFLTAHDINEHNLTDQETRYLLTLHVANGPVRPEFLAFVIGKDPRRMKSDIEQYFVREGLIFYDASGRSLTKLGRDLTEKLAADLPQDPSVQEAPASATDPVVVEM